jgi:hypothetical protein
MNDSESRQHVIGCVRDMLLARRIGSFMHAVKDGLESWEVEDTISRLAASRHYAESVDEHLVERLERIEGRRKALMTAAACATRWQPRAIRSFARHFTQLPAVRQYLMLPHDNQCIEGDGPFTLRIGDDRIEIDFTNRRFCS